MIIEIFAIILCKYLKLMTEKVVKTDESISEK
jgi:hypothetical protein